MSLKQMQILDGALTKPVMTITKEGIWVDPSLAVDETAKAVLASLETQIKNMVQMAVAKEREACAELVWPKLKIWSEEEQTAMGLAFNKAQEKHGWYETLMAVGASVLKMKAAAIRARGQA